MIGVVLESSCKVLSGTSYRLCLHILQIRLEWVLVDKLEARSAFWLVRQRRCGIVVVFLVVVVTIVRQIN